MTLPHSERAERVLLAGLLREAELVTETCLVHGVTEEDLFFHHHRLIWSAVWSLVKSSAMPGLVNVYQVLTCRGEQRDFPGRLALWLVDLLDADPTGAWSDWACKMIRFHADRRAVIYRANEMIRDAHDGIHAPEIYAMQLS